MKVSSALRRTGLLSILALAGVLGGACTEPVGTSTEAHTEIPAEGSCEAGGLLEVANASSEAVLDDEVGLDSRAAANIVAERPFATIAELDRVGYVGASALGKMVDFAEDTGLLAVCQQGDCDETAVLRAANTLSEDVLDNEVGLDARAAANIVAGRPFVTFEALDKVGYVGQSALGKMLSYATDAGWVAECAGGTPSAELGIVSDLDKTVVPPSDPDLSIAPYPGVAELYRILERRQGGADGDMYYVTARQPESVTEIPAYLEQYEVPAGPINTGVSGVPWVAEPEKVRDVSEVMDATGTQRFLLFGDSSHRDPEVYKTIRATYGDRIIAGFIHKVNNTVSPHRVEGLYLHESYAEVAAILYGLAVITRDEALTVMTVAQSEGLEITSEEIQVLLDAQTP